MSHIKKKTESLKKLLSSSIELTPEVFSNLTLDNNKVAFICANPYYESFRLKLGDPCCNDAILMAQYYSSKGYTCYCVIDPSKEIFVNYLKFFTEQNSIHDLIIFYAGHGGSIRDTSIKYSNGKLVPNDEIDGRDETWVFKDGDLVDDEMREIWDNNKCGQIFVISDSCHSGTVIETSRNNVSSFCGCKDNQSSIQLARNGIFTYFLFEHANKKNKTLKEYETVINEKIKDYGQNCKFTGNRVHMFV